MRCKTKSCRRCFIRHGHACDMFGAIKRLQDVDLRR